MHRFRDAHIKYVCHPACRQSLFIANVTVWAALPPLTQASFTCLSVPNFQHSALSSSTDSPIPADQDNQVALPACVVRSRENLPCCCGCTSPLRLPPSLSGARLTERLSGLLGATLLPLRSPVMEGSTVLTTLPECARNNAGGCCCRPAVPCTVCAPLTASWNADGLMGTKAASRCVVGMPPSPPTPLYVPLYCRLLKPAGEYRDISWASRAATKSRHRLPVVLVGLAAAAGGVCGWACGDR